MLYWIIQRGWLDIETMVNTGTTAQQKKGEIGSENEGERGRYGLYSSGSLPGLSLNVLPPPPSCFIPFPPCLYHSYHSKPDVSVLDASVLISFSVSFLLTSFPASYPPLFPSFTPSLRHSVSSTLTSSFYLLCTPLLCAAPVRLFLLPVAMTLASCSSVRLALRDETKELSLALFI